MADASWLGLVGTVIGGAIGLAGGWLGPWLLEGRKEEANKKKRRAEKFEELVAGIYEFDHWLDNARTGSLGGDTRPPEVSPFAKIQAISAVYFPSFDQLIRELDGAAATYRVWMETVNVQRLAGNLTEFTAGYVEALKPYTDARDKLLDALKKVAHRELQ